MRRSRRCAHNTWSHRLTAVEKFDVNPVWRHALSCERLFHVCHEASRAAEIDIRFSWEADIFEDRSRQMTASVEILTHLVAPARPAEANKGAAVREREHQAADFDGKRMMFPIASC